MIIFDSAILSDVSVQFVVMQLKREHTLRAVIITEPNFSPNGLGLGAIHTV